MVMVKRFYQELICICLASIFIGLSPISAMAITEEQLDWYAQNNILFYEPRPSVCFDEADLEYDQERNASIVIGMLMQEGYTHDSALAVAGNIKRESSFNTRVIEGGKIVEEGWRAFDNGAKTFKGGFGLVQWTTAGRVQRLQEYADENNLWVGSIRAQTGYMIQELAGSFGPDKLNSMSLEEATFLIYRRYEVPGSSFWTTHNGKYYNDYAPSSLADLSETRTPAAWKAYHARLSSAKYFSGVSPTTLSGSCSFGGGQSGSGEVVGDGTSGGILAANAVNMAWPDDKGMCLHGGQLVDWTKRKNICNNDVKITYREAIRKVRGKDIGEYRDCGVFVAAVVRSSGVDPDWKHNSGTSALYDYMDKSKKWQRVENIGNTTNLRPGDILVVKRVSSTGYGHIMMYTGDYSKYGDLAMAALRQYTGKMFNLNEKYGKKGYYGDSRGKYTIFRYVGGN